MDCRPTNRKILFHSSHGILGISNRNVWSNEKRPEPLSSYVLSYSVGFFNELRKTVAQNQNISIIGTERVETVRPPLPRITGNQHSQLSWDETKKIRTTLVDLRHLHMSPVNWAGSVSEILPPHAFPHKNFDVFVSRKPRKLSASVKPWQNLELYDYRAVYLHILNLKNGSLHTRSFRRIHFHDFRYR